MSRRDLKNSSGEKKERTCDFKTPHVRGAPARRRLWCSYRDGRARGRDPRGRPRAVRRAARGGVTVCALCPATETSEFRVVKGTGIVCNPCACKLRNKKNRDAGINCVECKQLNRPGLRAVKGEDGAHICGLCWAASCACGRVFDAETSAAGRWPSGHLRCRACSEAQVCSSAGVVESVLSTRTCVYC